MKLAFPAWSASMTQVPAPMKETVAPLIVQTVLAVASIVNVTVRPDVAVAVTRYVGPLTMAAAGAEDVKLMVCWPWETLKLC